MIRIWAKLIKNQRIILSKIIEIDGYYHSSRLFDYLMQVCYELDIPTPSILYSHKYNYTNFNIAKFKPNDFVECVNFDMLTIEAVSD